MDPDAISRALCWITLVVATLMNGINAEKSSALCTKSEFWNGDVDECVPCSSCKQYPKTPSCDTCPPIEPLDSWRVAAITSLSVLAAVVVCGALLIGVLVHQRMSGGPYGQPVYGIDEQFGDVGTPKSIKDTSGIALPHKDTAAHDLKDSENKNVAS